MGKQLTPTQSDGFKWKRIESVNELEIFYVTILPTIKDAAKKVGYAIAFHGSRRRDLDLVAVPWTESHVSPQELCAAIHTAACGIYQESYQITSDKPCGRLTAMFPVCWVEFEHAKDGTGHIDLSIIQDVSQLATELERVKEDSKQWREAALQADELSNHLSDAITERNQLKRQVEELKAEKIILVAQNSSLDRALTRSDAQNAKLKSLLINAGQRLRLHNLTSKRKDTDLIEAIRQAID